MSQGATCPRPSECRRRGARQQAGAHLLGRAAGERHFAAKGAPLAA
jgi:hypothetical protein